MKKEKVIKATNAGELMHHYANSTFNKDRKGAYSYDDNEFYIDGFIYAKIISNESKVVLIQNFDRNNRRSSGYTSSYLAKCFNADWTVIYCERINYYCDTLEEFTPAHFLSLAVYNLKPAVLKLVDAYNIDKHIIESNYFRKINVWNKIDFNEILSKFVTKFNVSKDDVLNHIYNIRHYSNVAYKGWETISSGTTIDKPISFYLDSSLWHTKDELRILEFKAWKYKYYSNNIPIKQFGKTYEDIYIYPDKREAFEKHSEKVLATRAANKIKEDEIRQLDNLIKYKEQLTKWLNGENVSNIWVIPIHLRIKNDRIETTRSAIIPFEAGKRLFRLFNLHRKNNIPLYADLNKPMSIGHYIFKSIDVVDNHWYVTVGCHVIRDTEIDLFIESNDLKDWK